MGEELEDLETHLVAVMREVAMLERLTVGSRTLTLPESFVLRELADGELSQQELADRLRIDRSRVSRIASAMEGGGWLERVRDPENRRRYRVRLTRAGKRLCRELTATLRARHAGLFDAMTPAERSALCRGLAGLRRVFDGHAA